MCDLTDSGYMVPRTHQSLLPKRHLDRFSRFAGSSGSMVSGALGKISIDCPPPPSDGPSDESFQLSLLSFFGAPSLSALGSCPSRLPLNLPLFAGHTNMAYTHTYIHTHIHTNRPTVVLRV